MGPAAVRGPDGWFRVRRRSGAPAAIVEGVDLHHLDVANTAAPSLDATTKARLRELCRIPRLSTFAVAAFLQRAVAAMPRDQAFVNVGVWHGFTFLAAVAGNADRRCVGIDDFSQFGGPRDAFSERFERHRGPLHEFHDTDFRDYFARAPRRPIGVYLYDGDHSYKNQLGGLRAAEPSLADGCLVVVDDTNWDEPRQATLDFIAASREAYELVADLRTSGEGHPTLWNGMIVARKGGVGTRCPVIEARAQAPAAVENGGGTDAEPRAGDAASDHPLVSAIVVDAAEAGPDAPALAALREQTHPSLETVVVAPRQSTADAFETSRGELVCLVSAHEGLPPDAIADAVARRVEERRQARMVTAAAATIAAAVPAGEAFVLVDDDKLPGAVPAGRRAIPFLERDGRYWGRAGDAATAIAELERLRAAGAGWVAFAWPAFWWLETFPALAAHLDERYERLLATPEVVVFALGR